MTHRISEENIDSLSVIARQCIAVICLERFCRKYRIEHPDIQRFVDHVWKVTQVNPDTWSEWENGFSSMPITGLGDPLPANVLANIPASIQQTFDLLVQHVLDTSASTWYGSDLPATKTQLLAVFEIMHKHDIPIPAIDPFQSHPKQQNNWGPCLTDQEVQSWRTLA